MNDGARDRMRVAAERRPALEQHRIGHAVEEPGAGHTRQPTADDADPRTRTREKPPRAPRKREAHGRRGAGPEERPAAGTARHGAMLPEANVRRPGIGLEKTHERLPFLGLILIPWRR